MNSYKKSFKINKLTVKYDLREDFDDMRPIDDFMGVLKDYCKTSKNERIAKLVKSEKSTSAKKVLSLVDNHGKSQWYYSTDSDIWYFNEIVTKTMIDYGYLSYFIEMIFSHEAIPNLRSEIVKYILANWEWISVIYHPNLLDSIAKSYGKLSLKNSRIEEDALRCILIKKIIELKILYGEDITVDEVDNYIVSETRNDFFNNWGDDSALYVEKTAKQDQETPKKFDKDDPIVRKAVQICIDKEKCATSLLQVYLSKGHGFIASLQNWLEEIGAVGPMRGNMPREVLIRSMEDFDRLAMMINNRETRELKPIDWKKERDSQFRRIGDSDVVMRGHFLYNYDDDCWRYAPDIYFEFHTNKSLCQNITEEEAKNIVENNGGTNFDNMSEALFVIKNSEFVGL